MPLVTIFYSNFGPYHIARLNALAKIWPNILAVETDASGGEHSWRTQAGKINFASSTVYRPSMKMLSNIEKKTAVRDLLFQTQPAAVLVVGYNSPEMREIAIWGRRHRIPCIMTTDTTVMDKPRNPWKEFIKRLWCRRYYGALFLSGERSSAYYTRLGFPKHLIWRGTNVVDNGFFENSCRAVHLLGEEVREQLGLPMRYFVTVCRLSPEKNVGGLLAAYAKYKLNGGTWGLVIVGSGPDGKNLKDIAVTERIPGVHFVGWKQYEELPAYYALASCFVLASTSETWGLVVNEAMACGLPVLVSRSCGCLPELCKRGVNGYDFDPEDSTSLADLMLRVAADPLKLVEMGRQSLRIIANFTPETWALSIRDCIRSCLNNGKQH